MLAKALSLGTLAAAALWGASLYRAAADNRAHVRADTPALGAQNGDAGSNAELEHLRSNMVDAERRLAQLEQEKVAAPAPAPRPAEPALDTKSAARQQFTQQERREHIAQVFDAEPADPSWKPEPEFRALMREVLPADATLRAIDCRTSLCRIETSHPNAESQRAYVNSIGFPRADRVRPFAGALFDEGEPTPDGREVRSTTYFVRPGRELPSVLTP